MSVDRGIFVRRSRQVTGHAEDTAGSDSRPFCQHRSRDGQTRYGDSTRCVGYYDVGVGIAATLTVPGA